MNEDFEFIEQYRTKGAIFDTNLLLVYAIGKRGREFLSRSKRTSSYSHADFRRLEWLVDRHFKKIYTTPNILTEVSNLGPNEPDVLQALKTIIQVLEERYCASKSAAEDQSFAKLGLTDSGLLTLGREFLVVTADFPLYRMLRSRGLPAVNFNHLRPLSITGD